MKPVTHHARYYIKGSAERCDVRAFLRHPKKMKSTALSTLAFILRGKRETGAVFRIRTRRACLFCLRAAISASVSCGIVRSADAGKPAVCYRAAQVNISIRCVESYQNAIDRVQQRFGI